MGGAKIGRGFRPSLAPSFKNRNPKFGKAPHALSTDLDGFEFRISNFGVPSPSCRSCCAGSCSGPCPPPCEMHQSFAPTDLSPGSSFPPGPPLPWTGHYTGRRIPLRDSPSPVSQRPEERGVLQTLGCSRMTWPSAATPLCLVPWPKLRAAMAFAVRRSQSQAEDGDGESDTSVSLRVKIEDSHH